MLLVFNVASAANQVEVSGTITSLRTQTSHNVVQASDGLVIFKLSNSLTVGCNWLGVEKGNSNAVSFLLSALSQEKIITAWYYSDVYSQAWSGVCLIANLELK